MNAVGQGSPPGGAFGAVQEKSFAERGGSSSGGSVSGIRNLPLRNGRYPFQTIPAAFQRLLQPTFSHFRLDLDDIRLVVKPLNDAGDADPIHAKTYGGVIAIDTDYLATARPSDLFGTLAHEATHTVQIRALGRAAADARYMADVGRYGRFGQYDVPSALQRLSISQVNAVDKRFALEAIANHVEDLAYEAAGL
jgi:hypothetical protein